jgi:hypothetical protein
LHELNELDGKLERLAFSFLSIFFRQCRQFDYILFWLLTLKEVGQLFLPLSIWHIL